jgi:hypothetical protein
MLILRAGMVPNLKKNEERRKKKMKYNQTIKAATITTTENQQFIVADICDKHGLKMVYGVYAPYTRRALHGLKKLGNRLAPSSKSRDIEFPLRFLQPYGWKHLLDADASFRKEAIDLLE